MLFVSSFRMGINELLQIIFTHSYLIGEDFNLERVISVQNLITWVECTQVIIYN